MRIALIPALILSSMLGAQAPELPLRAGWRKERLEFPLSFAPGLPYKGYEDLRFMPGMFNPDAKDYFSYAFVWWIEGLPTLDAKGLESQLTAYFQGLATDVGKGKSLNIPSGATLVHVKRVARINVDAFQASVRTVDAFNGARALDLRLDIQVQRRQDHTAVFFAVAPKQGRDTIRKDLQALVAEGLASGLSK